MPRFSLTLVSVTKLSAFCRTPIDHYHFHNNRLLFHTLFIRIQFALARCNDLRSTLILSFGLHWSLPSLHSNVPTSSFHWFLLHKDHWPFHCRSLFVLSVRYSLFSSENDFQTSTNTCALIFICSISLWMYIIRLIEIITAIQFIVIYWLIVRQLVSAVLPSSGLQKDNYYRTTLCYRAIGIPCTEVNIHILLLHLVINI
jgi:hypothetical protein